MKTLRMPTRQTLYRLRILDEESYRLVLNGQAQLKTLLWLRDGNRVRQISTAQTLEEVVDLAPLATGLAEAAWYERLQAYGTEVCEVIGARLPDIAHLPDPEIRDRVYGLLIAALRWRGKAGADTLVSCFEDLEDVGKSFGCIVLGLLGEKQAADHIWTFYQQANQVLDQTNFIGALWGLIDLGDPRAGEALAALLEQGRDFPELSGFLSMAGGVQLALPLLRVASEKPDDEKVDLLMALAGIAHRLGREALLTELDREAETDEERNENREIVDGIFSTPESTVREYFALFYRGFRPDEASRALKKLESGN